jgi:hypothetical protein
MVRSGLGWLRFEARASGGQLLGLDRIPEVHTLRAKLGQMVQGRLVHQLQGDQVELSEDGLDRHNQQLAVGFLWRAILDLELAPGLSLG